jgi:hypothetical protein
MRDHLMMGDSIDQMSLVEKLDSPNPDVRAAAAYALQGSTITDDFAAMRLVQNLESPTRMCGPPPRTHCKGRRLHIRR